MPPSSSDSANRRAPRVLPSQEELDKLLEPFHKTYENGKEGVFCGRCDCGNEEPCGMGHCGHCGAWASGRQVGWLPYCEPAWRCDAEVMGGDCYWGDKLEGEGNPCGEAGKCLQGRKNFWGSAPDNWDGAFCRADPLPPEGSVETYQDRPRG